LFLGNKSQRARFKTLNKVASLVALVNALSKGTNTIISPKPPKGSLFADELFDDKGCRDSLSRDRGICQNLNYLSN
jgi:hypothetical protein